MIKAIIFDLVGTLYDLEAGKLFPEVSATLRLLRDDFSLILVTDLKEGKKELLDGLGIEKYFDDVVIQSKSNDLFSDILFKKNIKPYECLVVGDDATNEIQIAKSIRAKFLLVDRKGSAPRENSIKSLFEIYLGEADKNTIFK